VVEVRRHCRCGEVVCGASGAMEMIRCITVPSWRPQGHSASLPRCTIDPTAASTVPLVGHEDADTDELVWAQKMPVCSSEGSWSG
jgi:hypothetical protein